MNDRRRQSTVTQWSKLDITVHLFISEYGSIDRIVVDERRSTMHEAGVVELEKQPLRPSVVITSTCHQFLKTVTVHPEKQKSTVSQSNEAPSATSCSRICSIFVRVHSDGHILCSLAAFSAGSPNASHPIGWRTRSPCNHLRDDLHHVQRYVERAKSCENIADRVDAHVSHVQLTGWIGEHGEHVGFLARRC